VLGRYCIPLGQLKDVCVLLVVRVERTLFLFFFGLRDFKGPASTDIVTRSRVHDRAQYLRI
jgi:hypothetical protein